MEIFKDNESDSMAIDKICVLYLKYFDSIIEEIENIPVDHPVFKEVDQYTDPGNLIPALENLAHFARTREVSNSTIPATLIGRPIVKNIIEEVSNKELSFEKLEILRSAFFEAFSIDLARKEKIENNPTIH